MKKVRFGSVGRRRIEVDEQVERRDGIPDRILTYAVGSKDGCHLEEKFSVSRQPYGTLNRVIHEIDITGIAIVVHEEIAHGHFARVQSVG